jgi:hypothetical protein
MTFTVLGQVPIASLRPIFLYLRKNGTLPRVHSRLLEILHPPSSFPSLDIDISGTLGGTNEVKYAFQRSLKRHLFGCRDLLSLRLRLSVADFCWVCGVHLVPHTSSMTLVLNFSKITRKISKSKSSVVKSHCKICLPSRSACYIRLSDILLELSDFFPVCPPLLIFF